MKSKILLVILFIGIGLTLVGCKKRPIAQEQHLCNPRLV